MFELSEEWTSIILVSSGAVPGACLRRYLVENFSSFVNEKSWMTLMVNMLACFFLGFFFSLSNQLGSANDNSRLALMVCVGFLGSLSTFSTFIFELLNNVLANRLNQALMLSIFSLCGGFLAVFAGYMIRLF